eukprot:GHVR01084547.1.p1 GENE.GHVR01084547.1~~GHVR01084547.1.p1  ORF type:complete len:324 (-),score=40.76 GHVR01084547.1:941-1867(-)
MENCPISISEKAGGICTCWITTSVSMGESVVCAEQVLLKIEISSNLKLEDILDQITSLDTPPLPQGINTPTTLVCNVSPGQYFEVCASLQRNVETLKDALLSDDVTVLKEVRSRSIRLPFTSLQILEHRNDKLTASLHAKEKELKRFRASKELLVNTGNDKSPTHMIEACKSGLVEACEVLIAFGHDVNYKDSNGWTPLMFACAAGHLELSKLLIKKGAIINSHSNDQGTPLMVACAYGHVDMVMLLIEEGAEVNSKNSNGLNPLMFASGEGHLDIVKLLIEKASEIDSKENVTVHNYERINSPYVRF